MFCLEASASAEQERNLRRLGANLALRSLDLADSVEVAISVVSSGCASPAALTLAALPSDSKKLSSYEVEPLVRSMLAELGQSIPSESAAGWTVAGYIAEAMIAGAIDPPTGAHRLWGLWHVCGRPGELAEMLQLHDEWESSVGQRRTEIEVEMLGFASTVAIVAEQHSIA